jgi:hypothetical protein
MKNTEVIQFLQTKTFQLQSGEVTDILYQDVRECVFHITICMRVCVLYHDLHESVCSSRAGLSDFRLIEKTFRTKVVASSYTFISCSVHLTVSLTVFDTLNHLTLHADIILTITIS